ncbi:MAG: hypothetical protein Kow0063_36750 [Anaerolineae bacterium]
MISLRRWLVGPWGGLILGVVVAALLRYPGLDVVPPGLAFDEAGNGVAALEVAQGQYRLWWPIGGGKEPLIVYLLQPLFWLFGPTRLALRLYPATMGVLSVAGTYWLAYEMFVAWPASERGDEVSRLPPVFAALGLATAFWHVALSRVAFRALALPAVEVLAFAWLWRALCIAEIRGGWAKAWPHFAGAGFLVGLAPYTYLPGRFVPLVLILFLAAEAGLAWLRYVPPLLVRHSRGIILSAVVALLAISPLLVFFALHPQAFTERAGAVSIFNPEWNEGDLGGALLRVTLVTLGTFAALSGDPNPIANLPGRPMLGLPLAVFFWLGVITGLWRIARYMAGGAQRPSPVPQPTSPYALGERMHVAAPLFLLCWWLVMLLPGILAPESPPHHLRIIGTAPATYVLVAVGLGQIANSKWQMANGKYRMASGRGLANLRRLYGSRFVQSAGGLVVLGFLVIGLATAKDYFGRWARLPELYMAYDTYALELVDQMAAETDPSTVFVIPMDLRARHEARHYTLDFLYRGKTPYYYLPVDEATVAGRLTEISKGRKRLRVVRWLQDKHAAADEREVVTFLLAGAARLVNEETFPVYRLEDWALPSADTRFALPVIEEEVGVTFGDVLRLEAVDRSVVGETVAVAIRWAPVAAMDVDYKASLRLVAANGSLVAQKDRFLRHNWHQGTSLWPAETVNEYYLLSPVPAGEYQVRVLVYHPETLAPLTTGEGAEVSLGLVQVK